MVCVRCGAENFDGESSCQKCGASLPKIPSGLSLRAQSRGNLDKLEGICRGIKDGSVSREEFLGTLQAIQAKLESCAQNLRNVQLATLSDSELQALLDEEYTTALEGTEMMLEAVAEIGAYLEHFEDENYLEDEADHAPDYHFETGLALAGTATETLNRSIEIGNEVRTRLGKTTETESVV